ncbi:elongation factor G [Megalodesulfovibrio gigas]|uniref:Elongation factor G n=1 Tax=Megalodesulfovibrio gigas (strain ATCC 19364 / DSM 1382 / NCIMB 9332 / VKM B-1759) TaxID=1121448 RepID=T2GDK3_MEGG1|nr:elongation factor G [Megalodesulfovibrio gigas]AGW14254.1 putative translation elongation factor G [Megalodesulfovibrio gigas DSM 1382 = ATCC 19364]
MAKRAAAQARVRNLGIIAHIDAGKTTLSERILYYTHKIHRLGEVHEGTAAMDYLPEEQERGITIVSACTTVQWHDHTINLIDTPGHVDFTIEVERSLRVLDGAVGVFCAVGGVEPQSETVWRQSEKFAIPKLAFINKMDRPGADFSLVLGQLETILRARPLPVQIPWGHEQDLRGVIDVVGMQTLVFDQATRGEQVQRLPLDDDTLALALPWRERLVETLAEADESLLDDYLAGQPLELSRLQALIRAGTLERRFTPVFAGSALRNIGVQPLLDGVVAYLPSPLEVPQAEGVDPVRNQTIQCDPSPTAPLAALVFKLQVESGHRLALLRLYAGTLHEGDTVFNAIQHKDERAQRIFHLHADHREQRREAVAGEIVGVMGLKFAKTGDTLCAKEHPLVLERIAEYQPVISMALEPRNADESARLDEALDKYLAEDPTLRLEINEETGQRLVSGMGELHLDVLLERMRREFGISPRAGTPQVLHTETATASAAGHGVFDRELGDIRHAGEVRLFLEPMPRGAGNVVRFELDTTAWPQPLVEAVSQGIEDGLQSGVLQGYPVRDVKVRIAELARRDGQGTPPGFHMAAQAALREALRTAAPRLLEPVMRVEIALPDEYVGEAVGLLAAKGGRVENIQDRGGQKVVQGLATMGRLFGFSTALRSATQGRAGLTMQFLRFDTLD